MIEACELCQRENITLTKHHALPKEEGGDVEDIVMICSDCHRQIHALYTNKELAIRLNTLQALQADEKLQKFVKFIQKQSAQKKVRVKKSQERKQKR